MKQMWQSFIRKITGKEIMTQQAKFRFLVLSVMAVHVVLLELFTFYYVFPLVMYNLFAVAFYLYIFSLVGKKKVAQGYVLTFLEMAVQIVLGTMLLGWYVGFFLYIFCIVTVSFYMLLSIPNMRNKLFLPPIITVVLFAAYIALYLYSQKHVPVYTISAQGMCVIYSFNAFVTFSLLGILSYCFILETMDSQNILAMQNQNLGHIASVDPLTGLFNRRCMENFLEDAMLRAKEKGTLFSLVLGDIDDFKKINDTYGHECGDQALIHVAEIMGRCVREGDAVCRWGGEEFLLLVQGNIDTAVAVGERIRSTIESESVSYQDLTVSFTMTFGVSTYVPGYRMETLIKQADDRLYSGKTSGKNKVVS